GFLLQERREIGAQAGEVSVRVAVEGRDRGGDRLSDRLGDPRWGRIRILVDVQRVGHIELRRPVGFEPGEVSTYRQRGHAFDSTDLPSPTVPRSLSFPSSVRREILGPGQKSRLFKETSPQSRSMRSSMRPTGRCGAGAGSTGRFTAREAPRSLTIASRASPTVWLRGRRAGPPRGIFPRSG